MGRWVILGIVVVVVLSVYAVVDCAMTDARRAKVMQKPIWLVVILLLPIVGPLLWMFVGKSSGPANGPVVPSAHPDTIDTRETAHDARIRELEEEMRKLDEEIAQSRRESMDKHPSNPAHSNQDTGDEPRINADDPDRFDTNGSGEGEPTR